MNNYIQKCINDETFLASCVSLNETNNDIDQNELANFIRDNLHKMSDTEMINTHKKIISPKQVYNDLLIFELKHIKYNPIDDFGIFIKFMETNLSRYHTKIMNTYLEDNEWTFHDHTSKKYPLKENEIIYENSLHKSHTDDKVTFNYLTELLNLFIRHISNKDTLKISLKLLKWSDGIYWVVYKGYKVI